MRERAYGTWPSPIMASDVAAAHSAIAWVGQPDGTLCWVESDPADGGRLALWRLVGELAQRLTPPGFSVRNRVHEYGGHPWAASEGAREFVATNWDDQRLYRIAEEVLHPLTPESRFEGQYRYAEPMVVGNEVWALREEFHSDSPTDLTRRFVAVPGDGRAATEPDAVRILGGDHRFLAGLRVSPDGTKAAWIGWNHPDMPWDSTEVIIADVIDGRFCTPRVVAGGDQDAICQVEWDSANQIVFLSDRSGWWNLYRLDIDTVPDTHAAADAHAVNLFPVESELGGALWKPGLSWLAPLGSGRYGVLDGGRPAVLDAPAHTLVPIVADAGADHDTRAVTSWSPSLTAYDGGLASVGHGPRSLPRLVTWTPADGVRCRGSHETLPHINGASLDEAWLPEPEFRWLGAADAVAVPSLIYPPRNPDAHAPAHEKPPYIVHIHGGPTGANGSALDLEIAYFTSRGIGVVTPDYGGSTGYGRAWRARLAGGWGVVDLLDATTVATALVADGLADPARLVIRGGSAGGFTSAAAMTAPSPFALGLVSYPVIDLRAWMAGENHDLESQYLVSIVGQLPEEEQRYLDRSPAERPEHAHGPMLVLQGLDDRICLAVTTERFVAALAASGQPYEYVGYAGEQHGFRAATTIADAIAREFGFLCHHLGIRPDVVEDVPPAEAMGGVTGAGSAVIGAA